RRNAVAEGVVLITPGVAVGRDDAGQPAFLVVGEGGGARVVRPGNQVPVGVVGQPGRADGRVLVEAVGRVVRRHAVEGGTGAVAGVVRVDAVEDGTGAVAGRVVLIVQVLVRDGGGIVRRKHRVGQLADAVVGVRPRAVKRRHGGPAAEPVVRVNEPGIHRAVR